MRERWSRAAGTRSSRATVTGSGHRLRSPAAVRRHGTGSGHRSVPRSDECQIVPLTWSDSAIGFPPGGLHYSNRPVDQMSQPRALGLARGHRDGRFRSARDPAGLLCAHLHLWHGKRHNFGPARLLKEVPVAGHTESYEVRSSTTGAQVGLCGRHQECSRWMWRADQRIDPPPSRTMTCPVMYRARTTPRMHSATSRAVPTRRNGTVAATASCIRNPLAIWRSALSSGST